VCFSYYFGLGYLFFAVVQIEQGDNDAAELGTAYFAVQASKHAKQKAAAVGHAPRTQSVDSTNKRSKRNT
jgi:hypothetical protein